jgi:nucleoside-triphosphatase
MKKHFFIEGPIQEGKSTLIRGLIKEHLTQVGGFSSQRLFNDDGETVGFRIVPAAEAMDLTMKYSPELSDVFLYFEGRETEKNPEIFTDTAIRYLKEGRGKKLILLDEIGGIELLMPEFKEALYEILGGGIPCLGVLKLEHSNRHMCSNANINRECTDYQMQLRDRLLNRYEAEVIHFERDNAGNVKKAMRTFLERIFP